MKIHCIQLGDNYSFSSMKTGRIYLQGDGGTLQIPMPEDLFNEINNIVQATLPALYDAVLGKVKVAKEECLAIEYSSKEIE